MAGRNSSQNRIRKNDLSSIERGSLGTGMMSGDGEINTDMAKSPSAADQGAEAGSSLQAELQKVDKGALKR